MDIFHFVELNPETKLLLRGIVIVGPLAILGLFRVLTKMLEKQIDGQMEKMIPLRGLRRRVEVRMKWH